MRLITRIALLGSVLAAVIAPAAHAGVVVWRSTTSSAIWEANDDGSSPHVIGHGSAPYISPDAKRLAYGNTQGQLTVVALGAPTEPVRVVAGVWSGFATWSPDSRQIGAQIGTTLFDVPADGGSPIALAQADHGWLSFGPASKRVAIDGYNDSATRPDLPLQTLPVGGGKAKQLQKQATGATGIAWSKRNVIAFAVSPAKGRVFTQLITATGRTRFRVRSAYDTYPDGWSDDGKRLLIEEDRPGGVRLGYVTTRTHRITLVPGSFTFVQGMSHDGARALVTGHDAKGRYVAVVSLSGGKVLATIRNAVDPSWTS